MSEDDVNIEVETDVAPEIGNVESMINALSSDDMVAAKDAFEAEIGDRMSAALDAAKIDIASSMYGSADEVSSDIEDSDMEIDVEDDTTEEEEVA